jgi:hypothetical protein
VVLRLIRGNSWILKELSANFRQLEEFPLMTSSPSPPDNQGGAPMHWPLLWMASDEDIKTFLNLSVTDFSAALTSEKS